MKTISRYIMTLALLLTAVTGAWAQTETLLTTITPTAKEQASYSTANVATVSFSTTAQGSSAYLAQWGWWGYGWIATVNAAEGYTITKCIFYDDANRTATDSEAPFVVETTEEDKTPKVNGTPILADTSKGIKKIEVYGYVTPTAPAEAPIDVTPGEAANTWTFAMPGSDVVLTPIYAKAAAFATTGTEPDVKTLLPEAAEGVIAGTDASLIAEGTGIVAFAGTSTEVKQGTLMYAIGNSATEAPALTAFRATVPTAENIADAGDVYVWYYIKGADASEGVAATLDNTFDNTEPACLTVTVLSNKFDIQFKAANANTIEAGKATVTVGGTDKTATVTEGKLEGVKMNSKVTIAVSEGYKIKSATAKQKEGETTVTVTVNEAKTEASFDMPTSDVDVSYELVRDITQKVDVETRIDGAATERIRIAKDNDGHYKFVTKQGWQFAAVDKLDNNKDLTNGELTYTLKMKVGDEYVAKNFDTELCPGIWRLEATANEGKPYVGTIYGHDIELYAGYDITVPAGEYVTYFKNEKIKVEDANAELYTITTVGETIATLSSKLNVAPASTPLLVYNNSTEQKTFLLIPATEDADAVTPASQFKGTLEAASIPASTSTQDNYALNGKAFVWVKNALNISANKCWLQINYQLASTRANTRSIVGGNGTTGIDAATSDDNEGDYYDLQGRKVEKPNRKGIYIQNGKKVIVR